MSKKIEKFSLRRISNDSSILCDGAVNAQLKDVKKLICKTDVGTIPSAVFIRLTQLMMSEPSHSTVEIFDGDIIETASKKNEIVPLQLLNLNTKIMKNLKSLLFVLLLLIAGHAFAQNNDVKKIKKVFVYAELHISLPFKNVPWKDANVELLKIPGLVRKTWLSGVNDNSVGGFYEFNSLESAQNFAWTIYPQEARKLGVSCSTKIFDGDIVEDASRGMKSPHYD